MLVRDFWFVSGSCCQSEGSPCQFWSEERTCRNPKLFKSSSHVTAEQGFKVSNSFLKPHLKKEINVKINTLKKSYILCILIKVLQSTDLFCILHKYKINKYVNKNIKAENNKLGGKMNFIKNESYLKSFLYSFFRQHWRLDRT